MDEQRLTVALVCMPFASAWRPSIQIGTLAPVVRAAGHRVATYHLQLDLAALMGPERYEMFADFGREPIGEWLFSEEAFGSRLQGGADDELLSAPSTADLLKGLGWTRADLVEFRRSRIPSYLDWLERLVPWEDFDVVGFTSTFQQNLASLALARRISGRSPSTRIVFGGANLDGEMGLELLAVAPWVDLVVSGEGEETFAELLAALSRGDDPTVVPGVAGRRSGAVVAAPPRALATRLDALPVPDYQEYFTRGSALRVLAQRPYELRLPFESSRGCWWGEKHHCTFCGLNGSAMTYRSKSPARVGEELAELRARHGVDWFDAVDNILDREHLRSLLPRLAAIGRPYRLFYEIKANLREEDVELLARAGVAEVQPGIESLSSHVLGLMDKGVSAAQNIEVLRWCTAHGIAVHWNVLYGFPGETAEDYRAMVRLMRTLHHLPPPESVGRIWMERFSPLFTDRRRFPIRSLAPRAGYHALYPPETDLSRIAYFFDYAFDDALPDEVYADLHAEVAAWQAEWAAGTPPTLTMRRSGDRLHVEDGRGKPARHVEVLGDPAAILGLLQTKRRTHTGLAEAAQIGEERLASALAWLRERRLVADDGRSLVALPLVVRPVEEPPSEGADLRSDARPATALPV